MKETENGPHPHPLLTEARREGRSFNHGFSKSQIQSLASFCEALIPPLNKENPDDKPIQSFYTASGSQSPIPDEVNSQIYPLFFFVYFFHFKLIFIFREK